MHRTESFPQAKQFQTSKSAEPATATATLGEAKVGLSPLKGVEKVSSSSAAVTATTVKSLPEITVSDQAIARPVVLAESAKPISPESSTVTSAPDLVKQEQTGSTTQSNTWSVLSQPGKPEPVKTESVKPEPDPETVRHGDASKATSASSISSILTTPSDDNSSTSRIKISVSPPKHVHFETPATPPPMTPSTPTTPSTPASLSAPQFPRSSSSPSVRQTTSRERRMKPPSSPTFQVVQAYQVPTYLPHCHNICVPTWSYFILF